MSEKIFDFDSLVKTPEAKSKPAKKWHRLPLWAWVIALPCWLIFFVLKMLDSATIVSDAPDKFEAARGVGIVLGSFLTLAICWGIALGIGLVSRSKRTSYASVFVVLSCFIAFGQVWGHLQETLRQYGTSPQDKSVAELQAYQAEVQDRRRAQIESGDYSIDTNTLDETAERLRAAGAASGTMQDRVIAEVSAALVERVRDASAAYTAAVNALADPSAFDLVWIEDREDLDDIRRRVAQFRVANEGLRSATSPTLEYFETEFAKRGIADPFHAADFFQTVRNHSKHAIVLQLRDLDAEFCDLGDRAVALLDKNWKEWSFDPETGELFLHNDELFEGWNAITDRVNAIAAEQTRLIHEIAGLAPEVEPESETSDKRPTTEAPTSDDDGD
ncbi:MAG: hypothetical protein KF757_14360 [Phycisphaeraceae bacterium]|nr:hypothetical protein [Phycisphaeraceae bacterium]MCW5762931.1 hypothetical protein [Phycisphaeraceae bacterium]